LEEQITTIGMILLGAFYAIGYLLNRHPIKKSPIESQIATINENQADFLSSISSTASQSTSLNVLLWERIAMLEDLQDKNQREIEQLKEGIRLRNQRITHLESQIQKLLQQSKLQEPQ